ncbi:hypothetical protein GP486_007557, partial [Trichoglossum hirsutum]
MVVADLLDQLLGYDEREGKFIRVPGFGDARGRVGRAGNGLGESQEPGVGVYAGGGGAGSETFDKDLYVTCAIGSKIL